MDTIKIWITLTSICLFAFHSCQVSVNKEDDDMMPPPNITSYDVGIFISHQGNSLLNINSSVSFRDKASSAVVDSIFQKENNAAVLDEIHSIQAHNDKIYLLSYTSGKVIIVDATSFQLLNEITGLKKPRHLLPIGNDKACISQWGEDGISGSIEIVDLNTLQITQSIPTRPGPERMIKEGNHLYVANQGGFSLDSVVTKIDLSSETVLKTIQVGVAPNSLQIDQNGHLWVVCQGLNDPFNPTVNIKGRLARVENDVLSFSLELATAANNLLISTDGSRLYFINQGWVFAHGLSDTSLSLTPFIASPFSHMDVHPNTGELFCVDPRNLQSDGSVLVFSSVGTLLYTFNTSVAPNGFVFRE